MGRSLGRFLPDTRGLGCADPAMQRCSVIRWLFVTDREDTWVSCNR